MSTHPKKLELLAVGDLEAYSVWRYVNEDGLGETAVRPLNRRRVRNLIGKLAATRVRLANGDAVWSLIGNADTHNVRLTEQFLTLSVYRNGEWFSLARYHDLDYSERGPDALAKFLGLSIDDVFPISYDLRQISDGDSEALSGKILKQPRERLTRAEIIALAVP